MEGVCIIPGMTPNSLPDLLTELDDLHTYEDAEALLPEVEQELEGLKRLTRGLDVEIVRVTQALKVLKSERRSGVLGKLFKGSSKEEAELNAQLDEYRREREEVRASLNRLQDVFDFTPRSPLERECILKELRLRKKALQEHRREITHVTHGPRLMRVQTPALPAGVDPVAYERRKARYARDSERLPGEDAEQALARQLAQVDQALLWAEKFPAEESLPA